MRVPVRVTTRIAPVFASVAPRRAYAALRRAAATSFARADFRIIHLAWRHPRIELVVEADDKTALARGMQGFQIAAARALNRARARRGRVFLDRYRPSALRTRAMVRALLHRTRRRVDDRVITLAPVTPSYPLLGTWRPP